MSNSQNPVLIHLHIFKNAGMTIEWILEKNFAKNFSKEAYGLTENKIIPMEAVVNYFKKNPTIKVFSSHRIRFPMPQENSINFIPIVFIRHPIDRAFSVYSFTRRQSEKGNPESKNMTLEEYFVWQIKSKSRLVLNSQLQFLSDKTKPLPKRVSSALERIKNCSILGVVDRFDESMVVAEEFLKNYFKNIDLSYLKQNVSLERKGDLIQRLENAREQISDELMKKLIEKNKKDMKLYEFANEKLNTIIKNIENFESKLSTFKERCARLTNQKTVNYQKGIRLEYSSKEKILLEKKRTSQ